MKRGEIWTVAGGEHYAGKPRPSVILQDDIFDAVLSVTVCGFTTRSRDAFLFRLPVKPDEKNGLQSASWIMVDKITTVPKSRLGERLGYLGNEDIKHLNRAIMVFLGLASSTITRRKAAPT